jgi:hypothetical protein
VNKNETFREYFRRAQHDAAVRRQLENTAQISRTVFGWVAVLFAGAGLWECVAHGLRSGTWLPGAAIFCSFGFVGNLLVWDKFGDRIAALRAMDETDEETP